ncbi:MAG: hypothetical protein KQ78_02132 [Candidatus Izimaplasma bacterium HR2]|nr:MAG: hypothetical protein KQ78_02132 [Candidatus Izimaplasma bacterium HR2]
MKKFILVLVLTSILFCETIPKNSAFLGNRKRGIGVEVTAGGDINLLSKNVVGTIEGVPSNEDLSDSTQAAIDSVRAISAKTWIDSSSQAIVVIPNKLSVGVLAVNGGYYVNITTVNAATYDLLVSDYILNVTYTATGAVTSLTLPTAQVVEGRIIVIKDTGNATTNSITIDTEGGALIDGSATFVSSSDYDAISLYCDGTNWYVF